MNELEIAKYLRADKFTSQFFNGVLAYDLLPVGKAPLGLYVVNTDLSTNPGKHWVCVFLDNVVCEYFDSLGEPPIEVEKFIKAQGKEYAYSKKRIQSTDSNVCGDYCILFAYYKCRGFSLESYIDIFTNDTNYNDALVRLDSDKLL